MESGDCGVDCPHGKANTENNVLHVEGEISDERRGLWKNMFQNLMKQVKEGSRNVKDESLVKKMMRMHRGNDHQFMKFEKEIVEIRGEHKKPVSVPVTCISQAK